MSKSIEQFRKRLKRDVVVGFILLCIAAGAMQWVLYSDLAYYQNQSVFWDGRIGNLVMGLLSVLCLATVMWVYVSWVLRQQMMALHKPMDAETEQPD